MAPSSSSQVDITLSIPPSKSGATQRNRPSATGMEQEGASRFSLSHPAKTPMPAALRSSPIGLRHPASTPPPPELRYRVVTPTSGGRRVATKKSAYAVRAEQKGQLVGLVEVLLAVRTGVRDGATLLDGVCTGTLWGWRARLALSDVLTAPLADWDNEAGRTQLERLAVVERALAECGHVETHRGGWSISSRGGR